MASHCSCISFSCHHVANGYGRLTVSRALLRPLPSIKEPIDPKKLCSWRKSPRRTKASILCDITTSEVFTYNGWSNVMEAVGSLLFLLCSTTKHSRECKAVLLVIYRFIISNIVTTDFPSGSQSALTLM